MSAEGLARFALSAEGRLYAEVCAMSGKDPAAPLESFDEVLAHDYRGALLILRADSLPEDISEAPTTGRVVTDLEERMRQMA